MLNKIAEARSLALQFMSANPCCIRVIPYEKSDCEGTQSLTMCLYFDIDVKDVPDDVRNAAVEMFANYEIEYKNIQRRPLSMIVTELSSANKQKEISDLSRKIENNLHLFEKRLNVTAVCASYKVIDSIEKNIPCVTVFVLGKGRVPAGETEIKEIKEKNGDLFDHAEFDVAEGYYQPSNGPSSLEAHTSPLQGGVGIGVQGVPGAGTLGGFLEDDEGVCYLLSNQHVLHPDDAGDNNVIVQPSELDYDTMCEKASACLEKLSEKLEKVPGTEQLNLTQEQIDQINEESRPHLVEKIKRKKEKAKEDLNETERNQPRPIGKYVCGLKDNVEVELGENKVKIFVDAAIATLDKDELSDMKHDKITEDETYRCPLYGFETNRYWERRINESPNGETIHLDSFIEHLRTQDSELSFTKIGRTTGFTDEGLIDDSVKQLYVNIISAEKGKAFVSAPEDKPCASALSHGPFVYCGDCVLSLNSETEIYKNKYIESTVYTKCGKKLNGNDEVRSFWARNCFVFRKRRKPFCEQGDSGALVFGNDGQAWGLVFGTFTNLTRDFVFCLASPLCIILNALRKKSGKKELKLW